MGSTNADWPAKFTFDEFWSFTEPLEGGFAADCMFMVQDLQVATGMGITFTNKVNRNAGLQMAKDLSWIFKPGHPTAGRACLGPDIERDYDKVLGEDDLGRQGPGHLNQWKAMTNCRITPVGLKQGVRKKVLGNIRYMRTTRKEALGDFDSFPADAQLCVISLTWANGNEFHYPDFLKDCRNADWFGASKKCGFKSKENTIPRRQKAQEEMMRNAGCVKLGAGDPDTLQWPKILEVPDMSWLSGWWAVSDENSYYYYFDSTGNVVYVETEPAASAPAPTTPNNRGSYSFDGNGQMVVKWNALPGLGPAIETFYNANRGATRMNANSNLYSPLVATKMS